MDLRKNIFRLFLMAILARVAMAATETPIGIQEAIEHRITTVIQEFDPQAIVFAQVSFKTTTQTLPGTPFVVKDFSVPNREGEIHLSKIDLLILTQSGHLPARVEAIVREVCGAFGPAPSIRVRALPHEMLKVVATPTPVPDSVKNAPKSDSLKVEFPKMDFPVPPDYGPVLSHLALIGAGLLVSIMLLLVSVSLGWQQLKRSIAQVASQMANAGGSANLSSISDAKEEATAIEAGMGGMAQNEGNQIYGDLPEEGIVALLTDCYWGEFDSYAAYVWRRLSVDQRKRIMKANDLLAEYIPFVIDLQEVNLGAEQEPYYLAPLPLARIANDTLTDLLRSTPALWARLSSLRKRAVQLKAREQVEMTNSGFDINAVDLPDFEHMDASPKRHLRRKVRAIPQSVPEEEELLNSETSMDMMESIPSLIWLSKLAPDDAREILQAFSATELASAWVGPETVLEQLINLIAPKKQNLLKSYQARVTPSRNSPVFAALHKMTVERMKYRETNPIPVEPVSAPEGEEYESAAEIAQEVSDESSNESEVSEEESAPSESDTSVEIPEDEAA